MFEFIFHGRECLRLVIEHLVPTHYLALTKYLGVSFDLYV